jgi:hypothetical protein
MFLRRRGTMIRQLITKPAIFAAVLLLSWGVLLGTAPAQEFEEEGYLGLYDEDDYGDSWFYDAYDMARDDDFSRITGGTTKSRATGGSTTMSGVTTIGSMIPTRSERRLSGGIEISSQVICLGLVRPRGEGELR